MKTAPHPNPICVPSYPRSHRRRAKVPAALVAAILSLSPLGEAWAQSDNFDDGNDAGWTQYSPLTPFGVPGVYTFPNGGYRIQTLVPTGSGDNPGRAGSLRQDVSYTDFYIAVDLVNWDPLLDQAFGIMARVANIGLGQTTGYAMTWAQDGQDLDISRITGEAPFGVSVSGNDVAELMPGGSYRLVFIGKGQLLTGRIYDLSNLSTPLAEIVGADPTYTTGVGGLVVYDNTTGGTGTTDATFDNYLALPEEPPRLTFVNLLDSQEILVSWPITYTGYVLESTPVLPATTWTEEGVVPGIEFYSHTEDARFGTKFFRLRKP